MCDWVYEWGGIGGSSGSTAHKEAWRGKDAPG